jgi:hypothetical protein
MILNSGLQGTWEATITTGQSDALGLVWEECETSSVGRFCGIWIKEDNATSWTGVWQNGERATLTILQTDPLTIRRTAGQAPGIYVGTMKDGRLLGTLKFDSGISGNWEATVH